MKARLIVFLAILLLGLNSLNVEASPKGSLTEKKTEAEEMDDISAEVDAAVKDLEAIVEDLQEDVKVLDKVALAASTAKKAGNKNCPVMGTEVDEDTAVKVEYKGKIYSLCCMGCIASFQSDPEKYSAIAELDLDEELVKPESLEGAITTEEGDIQGSMQEEGPELEDVMEEEKGSMTESIMRESESVEDLVAEEKGSMKDSMPQE